MNIASIRPTRLGGLKQLAKKISRHRCIPYTTALDEASRQAGFENFVHAKRQLASSSAQSGFPIYLSVHWHAPRPRKDQPRPDGPTAGREILSLYLPRPLLEIVAKHRVGRGRGLYNFRLEYMDHLEHRTNVEGQEEAHRRLLSAARSLRFMEATGLQPVTTKKYEALALSLTDLPGKDHVSDWFDPATGSYVCLDEPYADRLQRRSAERERWLERNGWKQVVPDWPGIYFAGECQPHLISRDAALLERIVGALDKVTAVTEPETWPHETGMYNDDFVSPQRREDAKPRRPRPGPSWSERNGATPYGGAPGIPSRWRPTKPMPIELHRQLGPLLQGLGSSTIFTHRVHLKLGGVRSNLEDWSYKEHRHELGDAVHDIYYGGQMVVGQSKAELVQMLMTARGIVERGYEDCKPRRELLAVFDAAISEMHRVRPNKIPSQTVAATSAAPDT